MKERFQKALKDKDFAELKENTTWDLVEDIEKIKNHLDIKSWSVFGGSWGSTLALAYGQTYPKSCDSFLLRGIFLLREKELRWFYQEGASFIFPDEWENFAEDLMVQNQGLEEEVGSLAVKLAKTQK